MMDAMKKNIYEEDKWLDDLLKENPGYQLPDDFADKLIMKIDAVESVKESIKEFLIIIGAILVILGTFFGVYYFYQRDTFIFLFSLLTNEYTPTIAIIVLFILFADKVLLRLLSQLKQF